MNTWDDDRIARAVELAHRLHQGQLRKDGRTPAVTHVVRVGLRVASLGGDPETIATALLHDAIEDTPASWDTIHDELGPAVADGVRQLSEDKRLPRPERRRTLLESLPGLPAGLRLIKLADVIDNLQDLRNVDWTQEKRARFLRDCRRFVDAARNGLPDLAAEADRLLETLEHGAPQARP